MWTPSFSPGKALKAYRKSIREQTWLKLYKLTNEIQFHEAFAKFKDSFKATILCVCRTLQREEVNE